MASTLSNLLYHFVFSTKYRKPVITTFQDELYKYITGIAKGEDARLISIGGMPDHVHIAIRLLPRHSVSKVLQSIKGSSSKWINDNKKAEKHFSWQVGFGAFSVSKSRLSYLINYIQNQENHHRQRDFKKEFVALLNKHGVEYDKRYLWD